MVGRIGSILGGLNVHVTDRSGVTSQCTYDADGFTRTQSWGQVVRNAGPLGGAAFGCNPNRAVEE